MSFRFWPLQSKDPSTEYMIRYLLGELPESSANALEEQCLRDAATFQSLRAAEADLIDAYVRGRLPAIRRSRFEERLLASPAQREKLANAIVIAKRVATSPVPARASSHARWIPIAATLLLLVGASLLLLRQPRHQKGSESLPNQPSGSATPRTPAAHPVVATFVLSDSQQRGADQATALFIPPDTEIVRFQVRLGAHRYRQYRVTVETPGGSRLWSLSNLNAAAGEDRGMMAVDVPAAILRTGTYIVTFAGESGKGAQVVGEYGVEVSR